MRRAVRGGRGGEERHERVRIRATSDWPVLALGVRRALIDWYVIQLDIYSCGPIGRRGITQCDSDGYGRSIRRATGMP